MKLKHTLLFGAACIVALVVAFYAFEHDRWIVTPLGLMLGSGLAAACFSQAIIWWKEYSRDEKRTARDRQFIALQIAVVLERYAIECAMQIGKIDQSLEDFYQTGSFTHPIPSMPKLSLPDAVEWRWLATELTSEVLTLAPKISFSDGSIEFTLGVASVHDGAEEAQRQLGFIGHEAWELARKVREQHKIPPQTYALGQWKFVELLKKTACRTLR